MIVIATMILSLAVYVIAGVAMLCCNVGAEMAIAASIGLSWLVSALVIFFAHERGNRCCNS